MTDAERNLLAAVLDRHADDLPRLVYADWADEHGQPERAELIRRQLAMSRPRPGGWPRDDVQRLETLINSLAARMLRDIDMQKMGVKFRRGFIEEVTLSMADYWGGDCPRRNCMNGEYDANGSTYRCGYCDGKGWRDGFGDRSAWCWPLTKITLHDRQPEVMRDNVPYGDRQYVWRIGSERQRRERPYYIPRQLMEAMTNGSDDGMADFATGDAAMNALSRAAVMHYRGNAQKLTHATIGR